MDDVVYFLTKSDRDKLADITDRGYGRPFLQPPPVRRRRMPAAKRTSASSSVRFARLLYGITGAAGPLADDWITAEILYQNDTTGVLDSVSSFVTHKMIGESIVADAQLEIQNGIIIGWTCDAVEWPEGDS